MYTDLERYEEALADLNSAVELAPNNDEVLVRRARMYTDLERYEEALADINQVFELLPGIDDNYRVTLLTLRGTTYLDLGRYEEALADLNRALELNPNNANNLSRRGETYERMGRYEEALADLNRALELNPGHEDALRLRENIRRATTPPQPPVRSNEMTEPDRIQRSQRGYRGPEDPYSYSIEANAGSPNVTFTCLRCEHKYSLWPCNNCGNDRHRYQSLVFESDLSGTNRFYCLRCGQAWGNWICSNCETRNPVDRTLTAQPTVKDKTCFIATASYGTAYAEEIQVLRSFRDEKLRLWRYGETLIRAYEKGSPPLANWIADKPKARLIARKFFLSPTVWVVSKITGPPKNSEGGEAQEIT